MKRYAEYKDSGVEWIGEIPSGWDLTKSKFLFKNFVEKNKPNEPLLSVTQHRSVVKRDDLEINVWNPESDTTGYKLIEKGDFVISLRSFEGGLELSEVRGIISPAYTVIKTTKETEKRYFKSVVSG